MARAGCGGAEPARVLRRRQPSGRSRAARGAERDPQSGGAASPGAGRLRGTPAGRAGAEGGRPRPEPRGPPRPEASLAAARAGRGEAGAERDGYEAAILSLFSGLPFPSAGEPGLCGAPPRPRRSPRGGSPPRRPPQPRRPPRPQAPVATSALGARGLQAVQLICC